MNMLSRPLWVGSLAAAAAITLVSCDKIRQATAKSGGSTVTKLAAADYPDFINQPGRVVLVDFYADWCGPCRKLAPILDEIASEYGDTLVIGKVDLDQAAELAAREGIRSIPDIRLFRDGRQVDKLVGLPPPAVLRQRIAAQIDQLGSQPAAPPAEAGLSAAPPPPPVTPADKDWLPPGMQRR